MEKSKLIAIISCVIAVALLACCFLFRFNSDVVSGEAYIMTVDFNDTFDAKKVKSVLKENGAAAAEVYKTKGQNTYLGTFVDGSEAFIYFTPAEGKTAEEVFKAADAALGETYFIKFNGEMVSTSAAFKAEKLIAYWPAALAVVVAVILIGIFFGVRHAFATLVNVIITAVSVLGIVSVAKVPVNALTIGALLIAVTLALLFGLGLAFTAKEYTRREKSNAFALAVKQEKLHCLLLAALAVVAGVIMLIMGNTLVAAFGLTLLIGAVVSALSGIFALPGLVRLFGQAE